ncbi:MAG: iron ABC transporter permease [Albidovulum sp.]|nr:iron ABC transporter permease [Albidovulum sp.]
MALDARSRNKVVLQALFPLLILVLILASAFAAIGIGAVSIPLATVFDILAHKVAPARIESYWAPGQEAIVWQIRLPRAILAATVGAGLAVVGAVLQSVTRNELADPHLLGISSGGAFGAILALLHTGRFLGTLTVPFLAFLGALAATFIVVAISRFTRSSSAARFVLAGVAVSFIILACANMLIFWGDPRATHTVVFWMLGGFGRAEWQQCFYPVLVLIPCGSWLWVKSGELDAMTIGDETASTMGITAERFRLAVFTACALVTGVMVAFSGLIGFVGLMIPHVARFILGGSNSRVVPLSAMLGAIFLIWADTASRTFFAPEEIPVGIVTGLFGGIFFVWLLVRAR